MRVAVAIVFSLFISSFLLAGTLPSVFAPVPLVDFTNGYVDPESGLFMGMGEIVNYFPEGDPLANVKLNFEFSDGNNVIYQANHKSVTTGLPIKGGFNVLPYSRFPFVVALNDTAISTKTKSFSFTGIGGQEPDWRGAWKPADLIVTLQQVHPASEIDLHGTKYRTWVIEGTILNNHTLSTNHVYVLASIHDKDYGLVGVAGYSKNDVQPLTLGGLEEKQFTLYATMPAESAPETVNLFAESDDSSMMHPRYMPLLSKYHVDGVTFSYPTNIVDGKRVNFAVTLESIARENMNFDVVVQILKVPFTGYKDVINDKFFISQSPTEHIEIIHSSIEALGIEKVQYSWEPSSSGYYAYAIYVVEDFEGTPKLISKPFVYVSTSYPLRFLENDLLYVR